MAHESLDPQPASGELDDIELLLQSAEAAMARPTALDTAAPRIPEQPRRTREEQDRAHYEMQEAMWEPNPEGKPLAEVARERRERLARRAADALAVPVVAYEPSFASDAARIAGYEERHLI
ncbi:MAG: hypothetical protein ACHQT5_01155 [Candidatus Saccharimonadales bacterium]|jgi:type IV secretory pathway VirB10-like protein